MRREVLSLVRFFDLMLIVILLLALTGNQLCFAKTVSPTYATSYDYVVRSGDVLEIAVWGHQDLSGIVTVSKDGKISLTGFLEEIDVLGLTIPEVQATISDMLAYYLRNYCYRVRAITGSLLFSPKAHSYRSPRFRRRLYIRS